MTGFDCVDSSQPEISNNLEIELNLAQQDQLFTRSWEYHGEPRFGRATFDLDGLSP